MEQDNKSPEKSLDSHFEKIDKISPIEKKEDLFAKLSLGLGLISIFFAWIGVIPLLAIVCGAIGINRTKETGTGRWMAVTGLVLGILFLIANADMNGHFSPIKGIDNQYTLRNDIANVQNEPSFNIADTEKTINATSPNEEVTEVEQQNADNASVPLDKKEIPSVSINTVPNIVNVDTPTKTKPDIETKLIDVPVTKSWSQITNFSGSGITNTQTFKVNSGSIRIRAAVQPSNSYASYSNFRLECTNCSKNYFGPAIIIDTYGGESKWDSFTYDNLPNGDYYISVYSMTPDKWAVIIEEYK